VASRFFGCFQWPGISNSRVSHSRMNDVRSYVPPIGIGEVMRSGGAGEVVESKDPKFKRGDRVSGATGWQQYAVLPGKNLEKLDYPPSVSLIDIMSVLGGTGLTAYFGLLDVGKPKPGDTLVVSGAAGATGMIVAQIGKIIGCRVVGIAGGAEKCAFLKTELGLDEAVDYKAPDFRKQLQKACPKMINVYFDNVRMGKLALRLVMC
jgi:NADPH-dependent curcumin reductase CurA